MTFPMPPPIISLPTMSEVMAALVDTGWWTNGNTRYRVRSQWLIGLIEEVMAREKREFAYNAEVKALASERLGTTLTHKQAAMEGDALSALVYNAQGYRRSELLVAEGFVPLTDQLLEEVGEGGQIAARVENLFTIVINGEKAGKPEPEVYIVRRVGGKLYAMKPRKRKYALGVHGQPVRVVRPEGPTG